MRKLGMVVLLTIFLFAGAAFAQQPVSSADQATTEDVLQMFKEMHFEQQMTNVQTAVQQQTKGLFLNMLKGEQFQKLPEEKKEKIREMLDQTIREAQNLYPIKELIADFAPMYAKYLTKSDVQTITAFYHSPTGQKLLDKSPEITREAMAVVGPKIQERMTQYMEKRQKEVAAMMNESGAEQQAPAKNSQAGQ
ncbi:MAG TPA: DUF2059 domain-containing protein [Terriglobales bacterium]|nr:DUF2059 domain-containing protein [Terriglobales bacterium]